MKTEIVKRPYPGCSYIAEKFGVDKDYFRQVFGVCENTLAEYKSL